MTNLSPPVDFYLLIASALLLLSIFVSRATGKFGIPALVLFLGVGMLAGSEGPGGIYFDSFLQAQSIGVIALAVILFDGGLQTNWRQVKAVASKALVLSTFGVFITAMAVGTFAWGFLGFSLIEGLLLGSIISSTDAAAVFSILRSKNAKLKGQLQSLLEFESGSNDPMAIFLTLGFIYLAQSQEASILSLVPMFVQQFFIGLLVGCFGGKATVWVINRIHLAYEGLYPVLTVAMMLLLYSFAASFGGSGFLAVYAAGIVLGGSGFIHKNSLLRFHGGLAWLAQIAMFLTLGLLVFPSHLIPVISSGVLLALFLMFVARPFSVWFSLLPWKEVSFREKSLISWVGLRGATPIVLAVFPCMAGLPQAEYIFNLIFFVVLLSVLLQGTTIPWVASKLGLAETAKDKPKSPLEFSPEANTDTQLVRLTVSNQAFATGKTIVMLGLPKSALIVLLTREQKFVIPRGDTRIVEGDDLLVLANETDLKKLQKLIEGDNPLDSAS